jgi:hypothetical protein
MKLSEDQLLVRYMQVIERRWLRKGRTELVEVEELAWTWSHFWPMVAANGHTLNSIMVIVGCYPWSKSCFVAAEVASPYRHSSNSMASLSVNCL